MKNLKKTRNQGFTLVELIVAIAILGVITLSAASFMSAGARTYSSVTYSLRLQYASQITMAHLQERIIDCNGGIAWTGTDLYVLNVDSNDPSETTKGTLHHFRYDSTDGCIYYGESEPRGPTPLANDLLAEHVSAMSVSLDNTNSVATVNITFTRQNKTYTAVQTLSLRNKPAISGDLSGLLDKVYPIP